MATISLPVIVRRQRERSCKECDFVELHKGRPSHCAVLGCCGLWTLIASPAGRCPLGSSAYPSYMHHTPRWEEHRG